MTKQYLITVQEDDERFEHDLVYLLNEFGNHYDTPTNFSLHIRKEIKTNLNEYERVKLKLIS